MTALRGWRAVLAPVLLASSAIAAPQASVAGTAAPIDVAKSLYAAFERGDLDALQSLLAPDVLWTLHGPVDEIPYAGDYRGPEGVRQFFTDVGGGLRVTEFRPDSFATEGDRVYVRGTEKGEVHATGGRYELV
jgi:ketosteroid isomerase-like protein